MTDKKCPRCGSRTFQIVEYAVQELIYEVTEVTLRQIFSAKYAFKYLFEKVSGGGTWESNPWVFVYDFELVK